MVNYNEIKNKGSKVFIDGKEYEMELNFYVASNCYNYEKVKMNLENII